MATGTINILNWETDPSFSVTYNSSVVNTAASPVNLYMNHEINKELKLIHIWGKVETKAAIEAWSADLFAQINYYPAVDMGMVWYNNNQSRSQNFALKNDGSITFNDANRIAGAVVFCYDFIFRYAEA